MKGLILKDLYTVRFQIIAGFLLMLFPHIMLLLGGGGMNVGANNEITKLMSVIMYGLINLVNICLFSSFVLNTLEADVNSGWAKMQRTLPVTGSEIIGAKLASSGIIVGILTLTSLAFNLVGALIFGVNLELMITLPLCIGLYQMIVLAPLFPLAMKIGARFTGVLYIVTEVVVLGLLIWLLVSTLDNGADQMLLRIMFYGGLPALAAASAVLSYSSGRKAIESCI